MEKRLFGFLFFTRNGLHNIKEIFRKGKIEIGKDGACMMTSVHHWLKAEKQINEIFSEPLVSEWGLGCRLCAWEEMGLKLQLYKFKNNDNLTLVKIPTHYIIDFCKLDPKRDIVVLCPSLNERKRYFEVGERYRTKKT